MKHGNLNFQLPVCKLKLRVAVLQKVDEISIIY